MSLKFSENGNPIVDYLKINSDEDGIKIFIDPKASMFLIGSEMVYKESDLPSGFDFINPNEKGRCGFGESFKV